MIRELIQKTKIDYEFLKKLSPHHELLKYFSVTEQGLIYPDGQIMDEFIDRFRKEMPRSEVLEKNNNIQTLAEYQYMLILTLFKNYISSLEDAIQFAEIMN